MIKNKKRSLLLLSAVIILIVIIFSSVTSNSIMKINISDIKIKNVDSRGLEYGEYSVDEQVEKTILSDPDEYRYIGYYFNAENTSKNAKIIFVDLQPIFSKQMNENVIYYDKANDLPTSTILNLCPQESQTYFRKVLVKRNGLSNEELIKLAQGDKFRVRYSANRWYSLYGILPNIKIAVLKK